MDNVSSGNTIRNSLEKIDNYLQQKDGFVVLTQIAQDLNLHFRSVKKCIATLQKLNRVEVVTNGNITLIKFKGEKPNAN